MDSKRYERIVRTAQGKFPIKLEDEFIKNLARIETDDKVYYARRINDIIKDIKDYYWITIGGRVWSEFSNRFLSNIITNHGYPVIKFQRKGDKNGKTMFIHRLIMLCFNYVSDHKDLQVNHIDGIKKNSFIDNLEWCTPGENIQHAYDNDLMDVGKLRKFTEDEAREVSELIQDGERTTHILDILDLDESYFQTIQDLKRKDIYRNITKDYDFSETNKLLTINVRDQKRLAQEVRNNYNNHKSTTYGYIKEKYDIEEKAIRKLKNKFIKKGWLTEEEVGYITLKSRRPYLAELIIKELSTGERPNNIIKKLNLNESIGTFISRLINSKPDCYDFIYKKYTIKDYHPFHSLTIDDLSNMNKYMNDNPDYTYCGMSRKLDITKSVLIRACKWIEKTKDKNIYSWLE